MSSVAFHHVIALAAGGLKKQTEDSSVILRNELVARGTQIEKLQLLRKRQNKTRNAVATIENENKEWLQLL